MYELNRIELKHQKLKPPIFMDQLPEDNCKYSQFINPMAGAILFQISASNEHRVQVAHIINNSDFSSTDRHQSLRQPYDR